MQVGRALDVLRLDVPLGFDKEPDLSIYTDDIRFRDDSRIYSQGKFMYQMLFFSLRLARVFMPMPPIVEVLSMRYVSTQPVIMTTTSMASQLTARRWVWSVAAGGASNSSVYMCGSRFVWTRWPTSCTSTP